MLWHTDIVEITRLGKVELTNMVRKQGFGKTYLENKQTSFKMSSNNQTGLGHHYKDSGIIVYTLP